MPNFKRVKLLFDIHTENFVEAHLNVPADATEADIKEILLEHINTVGIRNAGKPGYDHEFIDGTTQDSWEQAQRGHHKIVDLTVIDYTDEAYVQPINTNADPDMVN